MMKRKDIILMLSKYFGRYPTIVEVNYFMATDRIKKVQYFTAEEHERYNPERSKLQKAYKTICNMMYVWWNKDKIKAKLEREERARITSERIATRDAELNRRKEEYYIRKAREGAGMYISKRAKNSAEVAIRKRIATSNQRMVRDILRFHIETNTAIPEEMWDVIIKYK